MEILHQSYPFLIPMVQYDHEQYLSNTRALQALNYHGNKKKKSRFTSMKSSKKKLITLQPKVPHIVRDKEGFVYLDYPFE